MQGLIIGELDQLFLEHVEERKHELEELSPSPNDKSLPQQVYQMAVHRVLVAGSEQGDDPRHDIALRGDALLLEMVTYLGMEYSQ